MDPAVLSVASGLIGSLIGGVSTLTASWFTQRGHYLTQNLIQQSAKLETLYAEFIVEASIRIAEGWGHHAESPEVMAGLYSAIERMRLASSPAIIEAAEEVFDFVLQTYAGPDRTFDDLQRQMRSEEYRDPLRRFSETCRAELRSLRR